MDVSSQCLFSPVLTTQRGGVVYDGDISLPPRAGAEATSGMMQAACRVMLHSIWTSFHHAHSFTSSIHLMYSMSQP